VPGELLALYHDQFAATLNELEGRAQYTVKGRYVQEAVLSGQRTFRRLTCGSRSAPPATKTQAGTCVFAAGRLSSYYSGEVLAPTGGETLPG
jgi:hypothetical protein